jgi:hypothetical protein
MNKTLSSTQTLYVKIINPVVLIVGVFVFAFLWFNNRQQEYIIGIAVITFALLFSLPFALIIQNVRITSDSILVKSFLKELEYPLTSINRITEYKMYRGRIITIHLNDSNGINRKIRFLPKYSLFGLFKSHPIISELNDIVDNLRLNSKV